MKRLIVMAILFLMTFGGAAYAKRVRQMPLPSQAYTARTIGIVNMANQQKFADSAFDTLSKWGRLQIVQNADDADIKLVISVASDNAGVVGSQGNVVDISADWVTIRLYLRGDSSPFYTTSAVIARLRKNATVKCIDTFRKRLEEPRKH